MLSKWPIQHEMEANVLSKQIWPAVSSRPWQKCLLFVLNFYYFNISSWARISGSSINDRLQCLNAKKGKNNLFRLESHNWGYTIKNLKCKKSSLMCAFTSLWTFFSHWCVPPVMHLRQTDSVNLPCSHAHLTSKHYTSRKNTHKDNMIWQINISQAENITKMT